MQMSMVRSGVNTTSRLAGIFLRSPFSMAHMTKTPKMTASTPPLPAISTELSGTSLS